MRPIEVKLGRSIPAELLGSNELFAKCQRKNVYYNCPGCFGPKKIELLSLHESGHILYTHALGIADITLSGPSIEYDQDEKRIFAADGSVAWVKGPAYPTPGIKSFIGAFLLRETLGKLKNDPNTIAGDLKSARKWFEKYYDWGGPVVVDINFELNVKWATREIRKDLRSRPFRKLAWGTAHEFQEKVVGSNGSARSKDAEDIGDGILCGKHSVEAGEYGSETEWQFAQIRRKMRASRAA